jgi:hypothetical protein
MEEEKSYEKRVDVKFERRTFDDIASCCWRFKLLATFWELSLGGQSALQLWRFSLVIGSLWGWFLWTWIELEMIL